MSPCTTAAHCFYVQPGFPAPGMSIGCMHYDHCLWSSFLDSIDCSRHLQMPLLPSIGDARCCFSVKFLVLPLPAPASPYSCNTRSHSFLLLHLLALPPCAGLGEFACASLGDGRGTAFGVHDPIPMAETMLFSVRLRIRRANAQFKICTWRSNFQ